MLRLKYRLIEITGTFNFTQLKVNLRGSVLVIKGRAMVKMKYRRRAMLEDGYTVVFVGEGGVLTGIQVCVCLGMHLREFGGEIIT